jgi:hypothetical protein
LPGAATKSRDGARALGIVEVEQLGDEEPGLPHGEPAADHHLRGALLVATWQLPHDHRRARREQAEPDVGLHRRVQPLDEHEAAEDPALVAAEPRRDRRLGEVVVAVERADQPPLLELGEPAPVVQGHEQDLGLDEIDVGDAGAEQAQAEGARGAHALEAVEDLELPLRREDAQRLELAVAQERAAHGLDRGGVAQTQRREAVAEVAQLDLTLVLAGGLHEPDESTSDGSDAIMARDTVPESRRDPS